MRSLLYVPANSERFIAKAHERGADAIILDLEDAVPVAEKARARAMLDDAVGSAGRNGAKIFVRINAETWAVDAEAALEAGAYGLMVPKVRDAQTIAQIDGHLFAREQVAGRPAMPIIALIEDAGAVLDARAIASSSPRILGLALGGEDLATGMGAEPAPDVLRFPKLMVHYAAKAEGRLSFGLLQSAADYSDLARVEAAALEARRFGFDGATCVHPALVPVLNAAFQPGAAEIAWALRVIAVSKGAAADGKGAAVLDGKMIDEPVVQRARQLLERAKAAGTV